MRALIQRVKEARVEVDGKVTGAIGRGLLVFLGVAGGDTPADADYLLDKLRYLRIFPDEAGKMNCDVAAAGGGMLVVSQFTLYADCRRGRRPGFDRAAPPDQARSLYNYFVERARKTEIPVATGVFQASMSVALINDGPVTLMVDSGER